MDAQQQRRPLTERYRLGDYRIEQVLAIGKFKISYQAFDTQLKKDVVIEELLPEGMACREGEESTSPRSSQCQAAYQRARQAFIKETKAMAGISHPNVIHVLRLFETNNTAYRVVDFVRGSDYESVLQLQGRAPSPGELRNLLEPVLSALKRIHERGVVHLGIGPDHILMAEQTSKPVLTGFGNACAELAASGWEIAANRRPYCSPEQMPEAAGETGPWSDFYCLAATIFRALCDRPPSSAKERLAASEEIRLSQDAALTERYGSAFLDQIDWALALDPANRPHSVQEWSDVLASLPEPEETSAEPEPGPPKKGGSWKIGRGVWKLFQREEVATAAPITQTAQPEPPVAPVAPFQPEPTPVAQVPGMAPELPPALVVPSEPEPAPVAQAPVLPKETPPAPPEPVSAQITPAPVLPPEPPPAPISPPEPEPIVPVPQAPGSPPELLTEQVEPTQPEPAPVAQAPDPPIVPPAAPTPVAVPVVSAVAPSAPQEPSGIAQESTSTQPAESVETAPQPAASPFGTLKILNGPGKGAIVDLGEGLNRIGTSSANEVSLDFGDLAIAAEAHAFILRDSLHATYFLQPNVSGTALTYIGEEEAPVLVPTELHGGELIRLGDTKLRFTAAAS